MTLRFERHDLLLLRAESVDAEFDHVADLAAWRKALDRIALGKFPKRPKDAYERGLRRCRDCHRYLELHRFGTHPRTGARIKRCDRCQKYRDEVLTRRCRGPMCCGRRRLAKHFDGNGVICHDCRRWKAERAEREARRGILPKGVEDPSRKDDT